MKTIIVPTDFSSAALNAARYAVDMAKELTATVTVVHIYQVPILYLDVPVPVDQGDLENEIKDNLEEIKKGLLSYSDGKINIQTHQLMGVFFEELVDICKKYAPYFVIMGSQGTTAADRFFLGSHAVQTMKHLDWPVMTVPPEAKFLGIHKIGLACDFNKVIETTPLDAFKRFIKDFKAELHVLNTGKEKDFNAEVVFGTTMLQEMMPNVKLQYHFMTNDNNVEGIMQLAKENNIDLLIVLPKQHTFLEIITHKSLTKKLVLNSYIPVLALHKP